MRTSAFGLPATLTLPSRVRARHRTLAPCRFRGGGIGPRKHQPRADREYRIDRPPCLTNPRPQGGSFSLPPVFQSHIHAEPKHSNQQIGDRAAIENRPNVGSATAGRKESLIETGLRRLTERTRCSRCSLHSNGRLCASGSGPDWITPARTACGLGDRRQWLRTRLLFGNCFAKLLANPRSPDGSKSAGHPSGDSWNRKTFESGGRSQAYRKDTIRTGAITARLPPWVFGLKANGRRWMRQYRPSCSRDRRRIA